MKAYEFPAKISSEGTLQLPDSVMNSLSGKQSVKVILLIDESDDEAEADWHRLATEHFFAGYSEADAVYDKI